MCIVFHDAMHIVQTALVLSASSPKDETQHFLSVTFGLGKPSEVLLADSSDGLSRGTNKTIIKIVLLTLETKFPIASHYYPHQVIYRSDDPPSIERYHKLLLKICESANTYL